MYFSEPTPRREAVIVAKIDKILSIFYGTRRSITCSQEEATGSYPELNE
jgi:hypothetical protein